jgi:hypothetical protein
MRDVLTLIPVQAWEVHYPDDFNEKTLVQVFINHDKAFLYQKEVGGCIKEAYHYYVNEDWTEVYSLRRHYYVAP